MIKIKQGESFFPTTKEFIYNPRYYVLNWRFTNSWAKYFFTTQINDFDDLFVVNTIYSYKINFHRYKILTASHNYINENVKCETDLKRSKNVNME